MYESVVPSGSGNANAAELSNGLPDRAKNREFHMSFG